MPVTVTGVQTCALPIYSALEAKLGHEPSKDELLAFEAKCEKALNNQLKDSHTETYVLMIKAGQYHDARKVMEHCEGMKIHALVSSTRPSPVNVIAQCIRKAVFEHMKIEDLMCEDDVSTPTGTLDFFTHSMSDFMDIVNDDDIDLSDYFIGYVEVTVEKV
jgi:hypothetical protein